MFINKKWLLSIWHRKAFIQSTSLIEILKYIKYFELGLKAHFQILSIENHS